MDHEDTTSYIQEVIRSAIVPVASSGVGAAAGEVAIGRERLILGLLAVGLLAARLCHTGLLWEEEAYRTAAATQLLHAKGLYREVWFDKPPLLAYTYLLWGAQIGVPLRIAGAVFVFLCCWMAWRFARGLWSGPEG